MSIHILDPNRERLAAWLSERGYPPYRLRQIQGWLWERRAESFEAMSDLPKRLRGELSQDFNLWTAQVANTLRTGDGTEKLVLALADGGRIECVLLRDGERRTICISTQVGCAMGCVFCASGLDGVDRNLSAGEIVEQMLRLDRLLPAGERLSHIVVMGMGEPLANLDGLLPALDAATSAEGLGISPRRITISTVGLPKGLDRLVDSGAHYQLAVSLHASNDALRTQLVPVNKSIGLASILQGADRYFEASGRRLTFEYVLLAGVNDRPEQARELASLLAGRTAMLNLIPYNPVVDLPYGTPPFAVVQAFRKILEEAGLNVQVRERKGDKINAACGQLRRSTPAGAADSRAPNQIVELKL